MSKDYLIGTNVISNLIREPSGEVAHKLRENAAVYCCTSIVVACEPRFGAEQAVSDSLCTRVAQLLKRLDVLPLDVPIDAHYARLRNVLERNGTPIGSNAMPIAAHALALDLTLVSDNTSEFGRVHGLRVENWRRR